MTRTTMKAAALCAVVAVAVCTIPANALTSSTTWQNQGFSSQVSTFVAQFDAVPNTANMDGVTALSGGSASSYNSCAAIVRFSDTGTIDVRNGGVYSAATTVPYTAGTSYHFRVVVNVASHTYSVYVTPKGGAEQTLASNYAFRSEQGAVSSLSDWAALGEIGTHTVSNMTIGAPLTVDAGAAQSVTLPAVASLSGTVTVNGSSSLPSGVTLTWTKVSGPGTVSFSNAYGLTTTASFSAAGSYQLQLTAAYNGQSVSDTVAVTVASNGASSSTVWQNTAFAVQTGSFTAQFDATPNTANMDGVIGLSTAAGTGYGSYAAMVRFNNTGTIDARNGGAYAAASSIAYTAGTSYHFRLVVNVPVHTYSAYVTPKGGTEQTIGVNYAFRSEQATVSSLANWGMVSEVGTESVSGFTVAAQAAPALTASAGLAQTITSGQSCTLNGSASGGTSPYTYSWTPTANLSSASVASPAASPTATTTYTLTVKDTTGATASANVTVTVNAGGSSGGTTYYVSPSGSDSNAGTASAPWKTLSKAAMTAKAGDTVIVKAGTYNENFTPGNSGTAGNLVTFRSETPRAASINGMVDLGQADYVRIDGFSISNAASEGVSVSIQGFYSTAHGHGIQVANCYIHDGGGHAVFANNVTDLLIENNEMYNNYHDGVIFSGSTRNNQNVTIRGNYIHHNGQDGIHPEGNNVIIENNRIDDQYTSSQHSDGLEIYGPNNGLIIRNNIISDTTQNIYISAENYTGSYIRNVEVLGNISYAKNNPNLGKGIFVVGNTADVTNIRVEGNTFAYVAMNSFTDAYASSSSCYISGLTIRNNIFYMCDMSIGVHSAFTLDYNVHYYPGYFNLVNVGGTNYTSLTSLRSAKGLEMHGIQADPLFVNATNRDFHLTSGSQAINAGIPVVDLTVDADGTARPLGGVYDIGGYEKQ